MAVTIEPRLRAAIEAGRFDDLAELYTPGAQLEASLAGCDVTVEGPAAIIAELGTWWTGSSQIDQWDATESAGGLRVVVERSVRADGGAPRHRQYHWVHVSRNQIDRHVVMCAKPQHGGFPAAGDPTPRFLRDATDRRPLEHQGLSGSWLERVVPADGEPVIVKHISPEWDWIMRATHDTGREATIWRDGILQDLPAVFEIPVIAAEREGEGWSIVMGDVSAALLPVGETISRDRARRLLAAADAMHRRFGGRTVPAACCLACSRSASARRATTLS